MEFYKYSAHGNDFLLFDNQNGALPVHDAALWQRLCKRRSSVGADGVIFVESSDRADFHMRYLNSDGGEVEMCGNGTRVISDFFYRFIKMKEELIFTTKNSLYESKIENMIPFVKMVELYDVGKVDISDLYDGTSCLYLNTGVPHCVFEVDDVDSVDVIEVGRRIRNEDRFENGVNVNFFSLKDSQYHVRTYERGVEDETLSCGTGITACAHHIFNCSSSNELVFIARGGELKVKKIDDAVYYGGKVNLIYKGLLC